MLTVSDLHVAYGNIAALRGVSLEVQAGEIVAVIGPNGAGKSTLLLTITGVVAASRGEVRFEGAPIAGIAPERLVARGISLVPEGRRIFGSMSVAENIELGATARADRGGVGGDIDRVLTLFPILRERYRQRAGKLSGGEQQMLAIARALMARPKLLLMDEPSMGLAPILVERSFSIIKEVHESGVAILVVEQNANVSLSIADRGYVLSTGRLVLEGAAASLREDEDLRKAYLGR